jgi:hypothetical protein
MGLKTPFSPVCAEVRLTMDAVRDNRATTADRLFVAAHTENCPGCASEWAFLQATKTAWAKTPMAVPSASLSARIAAATYRKPTFAERLVAAFAFLNPAPVRVAIGVAAVAGISFLALPRMTMDGRDAAPVIQDQPPIMAQLPQPRVEAKKQPEIVAVAPAEKPAPPVKKASPKPVAPVVKEAPPTVAKTTATERESGTSVAVVVEKPAPKVAPQVAKPKPTQVAIYKPKAVRETAKQPIEATVPETKPSIAETEPRTVAVAAPAPVAPASRPEVSSPSTEAVTGVAGMTAPETDPAFADGSTRINGLSNAGRRSSFNMSGKLTRVSSSNEEYMIVSAPS